MTQRTVNDRQLAVLAWIGEGCPAGVMVGDSYKTTAAALRSRRLVTISKKRGSWSAGLTEAGRHFLEDGTYPEGHWPERSGRSAASAGRTASVRATGKRPAEQMVTDVVAAGGRLEVDAGGGPDWPRLVSSAMRYGKVPAGMVLTIERGSAWSKILLVLADAPEWAMRTPTEVPVPTQVRGLHAVVAGVEADARALTVSKSTRRRALLILEGLAREAERRGYDVRAPIELQGHGPRRGQIEIDIRGNGFALHLYEQTRGVPHVLTAEERRRMQRYESAWAPTYDSVPTGRLRLRIADGVRVRAEAFADNASVALENRLGEVLLELELRAEAADRRALERQLQEDARRERYEQVRAEAVTKAREHHRTAVLHDQARRWLAARDVDAYLSAVEARCAELSDQALTDAREWLSWARERQVGTSPLLHELRMPSDPEFTADELRPHMQGLSPYGP